MTKIHHATAARATRLGFTLAIVKGTTLVGAYLGAELMAKADDAKAALEAAIEAAKQPRRQASIVRHAYKAAYGAEAHCGDPMAVALKAATEVVVDGRIVLNIPELRAIAENHGIDFQRYANHNPGQMRMNVGNRLRGMLRRGERDVTIAGVVFPKADVED